MIHVRKSLVFDVEVTIQRDPSGLAQGFVELDLGSSPRLVGCNCSYLLPKQDGGTSQI